jgi:hypothetical protein
MKKLPIIGLIIGAIAAAIALVRRKKNEPVPPAAEDTDTTSA